MGERRDGANAPALVVGAVVVLGALAMVAAWALRERPYTASVAQPSPIERQSLVPLAGGRTACLAPVTIRPGSEQAIMRIGSYGGPPVPLTAIASGPGYRSVGRVPPTWADNGEVKVAVRPPAHVVDGRFCVRNDGRRPIALYAADDRSRTISKTTVDGRRDRRNFVLRFAGGRPASLISRLGPVAEAMSVFRPVGRGLIWLLALLVVFGVPVALVWTLHRALGEEA